MKKTLLMSLCIMLCASLAIGGTMAYLSDTDSDVNVMTLGSVKIEQIEQERDENGELVEFTQAKPLYPAVYPGSNTSDSIPWADADKWAVANDEAWKVVTENENVVDKFVTVKNTGKSDAYVRTLIAYEGAAINGTDIHVVHNAVTSSNAAVAGEFAATDYIENVVIDGVRYDIIVYTYKNALGAGETTIPSLKQLYMDHTCNNAEVEAYGDTYDVLVVSQAVQTAGFAPELDANGNVVKTAAEVALDDAFGDISATNHPWLNGIEDAPVVVTNAEELQKALDEAEEGDTIVLGADITADIKMTKNNITIDGTGHKLTGAVDLNKAEGTTLENIKLNGAVKLNGAKETTLKKITFDAAYAEMAYDGKGNTRFNALILSGDATKSGVGARGLTIDNCTFEGKYDAGGTTIAFNDQGRSTGQSGNITIKNCTFATEGGYVDIYTYYAGYENLVIENNTFNSVVVDRPIYIGRYQSSTPVVVKGNEFKRVATFKDATLIQPHSDSYTVSFDEADNTYATVAP